MQMKRAALSLAVLFAVGACKKEAPAKDEFPYVAPPPEAAAPVPTAVAPDPDATPFDWISRSPDGSIDVVHARKEKGTCTMTVSRGKEDLWKVDGCLGKREDFRFVGNDGRRVVILHPVPVSENASDWKQAEVIHVYANGKLDYAVKAGVIVKDEQKARISGNSVEWLAGTIAVPGTPPRYTAEGDAVEFETIEAKSQRIPLVPEESKK